MQEEFRKSSNFNELRFQHPEKVIHQLRGAHYATALRTDKLYFPSGQPYGMKLRDQDS
jgi:hypothetical protein